MQVKTFRITTYSRNEAEEEFNTSLRAHRIMKMDRQFVPDGGNSFWEFCVTYLEGAAEPEKRGPKVDYREVLDADQFAVFSRLRDWRKALAEQGGVQAYTIFTNEQFACLVRERVTDRAALEKVPGIGPARIEKFGDAFLDILKEAYSK